MPCRLRREREKKISKCSETETNKYLFALT